MTTTLTRRAAFTVAAATLIASRTASATTFHPVLVELFTSQGCSSCPPADKLAATLATDPNNVVVSFNVDYWDYLGWRDTLAKPEFSQRQYDYANARGDGSVYTPQMIINGKNHVVGSNTREVERRLNEAKKMPLTVALKLEMNSRDITVQIPKHGYQGDATLWLLAIETNVKQKIERGENAGSLITYTNVVRNLVPAAKWTGADYSGSWMRGTVMPASCDGCIAVLQQNNVGPVLGLARYQ